MKLLSRLLKDKVLLNMIIKSSHFMGTKIIGVFLGFGLSWFLSLKGGAELWGSFVLAFSIINIVGVISLIGLDTLSVKYISGYISDDQKAQKVFSRIAFTVALSAILFTSIAFLSMKVLSELPYLDFQMSEVTLIAITVPGFVFLRLISAYYRGKQNLLVHGFLENNLLFGSLFISAITFTFLLHGYLSLGFMLKILIVTTYSVVFCLVLQLLRTKRLGCFQIRIWNPLKLIKSSFPLLLVASLAMLTGYLDIFMLSYFDNKSSVGIYDIAIKYSSVTAIFLVAINAYTMPKISEFFMENKTQDLLRTVQQSSMLIIFSNIPIQLLLLLISPFALAIYGPEYLVGLPALRILILAQLISAICGPVAILLQMTDNQGIFQIIFLCSTTINVILNLIWIPDYGITGAALATLISTTLWNILSVWYAKSRLGILSIYVPSKGQDYGL